MLLTDYGNVVHVVGTGTIGGPLIGLFADFMKDLQLDEVTYFKNTPLIDDRSTVIALNKRGAKLCARRGNYKKFKELGIEPVYERVQAIKRAKVIVDCTPKGIGNDNKRKFYEKYQDKKRILAQGSEFGFGKPYAYEINEAAILPTDQFIHVQSCNTHGVAKIIETFGMEEQNDGTYVNNLVSGDFVCIRRSSDISESKGVVPSLMVDKHTDTRYGTHHARDAAFLYKTLGIDPNIFSSSFEIKDQYMHTIRFRINTKKGTTREEYLSKIREDPLVAITHKNLTSQNFSFGRDQGYYGRILNQIILVESSLHLISDKEITGSVYIPQDGNSLLSSVAGVMHYIHPNSWQEKMRCFEKYIFKEI